MIDVCPICKKKEHSSLMEVRKCKSKFLKSLRLGDYNG